MRRLASIGVLTVAGMALVAAEAPPQQTTAPQQPAFRAGTTIVPVDVRVLDKDGQPVTTLTQADFTVLENGKPQEISLFTTQQFTADEAAAAQERLFANDPTRPPFTDNRRVFVILLGRGRLEAVSKGMTAASDFVRNALLPQDLVAIFAWNRATEFTTDHRAIAALIDRINVVQPQIESDLLDRQNGLRGKYSQRGMPVAVQDKIDQVFQATSVRSTRVESDNPNAVRQAQDRQDAYDAQSIIRSGVAPRPIELANGGRDLDTFITDMNRTNEDVEKIYAAIEFLRDVEGEKHLVFVTQAGVGLPRTEDDKEISSLAADARVVIDTVQTGGGQGVTPHERMDATLLSSVTINEWTGVTLERFAEDTGGTSSLYSYAAKGFDVINTSTKFEYLLGYQPTSENADGKYRNIEVKVKKPGVHLSYRRGYFSTARPALTATEIRTYTEVLLTAGNPAHNFNMDASVADVNGPPRAVDLKLTVDGNRLGFINRNGQLTTNLTVLVMTEGAVREQQWHTVKIAVPENQREALKGGIQFAVRSTVAGIPRYVRVIVYDPNNGMLGQFVPRDHR